MKSKLLILLFALVSVFIIFNEDKEAHNQFSTDTLGYYQYLPAIFIYHDLAKLSFYPALNSKYHNSFIAQYSLYNSNGKKLDKYPVGVALFELPLFLLAHSFCHITNQYNPDGFTLPYQLAAILSNIFWVIAGFFTLRVVLKRYFNDNVTTVTLICIFFGTNLYAYNTFIVGMSHPYSFFLFCCLLLLTDKWYLYPPKWHLSFLIGLVLGLILIVRPINIIAVVIPLLWMINSLSLLKERMRLFSKYYGHILMALFIFIAVTFIQLAYWKYITGHWAIYSYQGERFDFLHPNIWKGLFSYRKGWFVYTPMAFIGMAGFYFLWKKNLKMAPTLMIFSLLMIYVVFSWQEWWYGGSFGCRPLIESFAFLSMPLAAIIENFYYSSWKIKKISFYIFLFSLIFLNIFQTYQYSMGLIHWEDMSKEYYWRVFGKIDFDREKNKKYLLKPTGEMEEK